MRKPDAPCAQGRDGLSGSAASVGAVVSYFRPDPRGAYITFGVIKPVYAKRTSVCVWFLAQPLRMKTDVNIAACWRTSYMQ
jgi:hypothetical protein